MYRFILLLGMLAGLTFARPCYAVQFYIILDFNTGPLTGQSFTGVVETFLGDGIKSPANGGLIAFDITVDGLAFNMHSDVGFDQSPWVELGSDSTTITAMSFLGLEVNTTLSINTGIASFEGSEISTAPTRIMLIEAPPPTPVPEAGSTLLLFSVGLLSMALARRQTRFLSVE